MWVPSDTVVVRTRLSDLRHQANAQWLAREAAGSIWLRKLR